MSKHVKFYSSDHFDSPVLKGESWGGLVNLLRKVLCEGFNERTDITNINILEYSTAEFIFATPHNYSLHQTIKIENCGEYSLDGEYFITEITELTVIAIANNNISDYNGYALSNLSTVICSVAPCGMQELWNDGNRSVFIIDEAEHPDAQCYFYIDDEQPSDWPVRTNIVPLVFITDKMDDINTVTGKRILPYDPEFPNRYKEKSYLSGTNKCTGIWKWQSYGLRVSSGNSIPLADIPAKWYIIGNGKFFYYYFSKENIYSGGSYTTQLYHFGKFKSYVAENNYSYDYSLYAMSVPKNTENYLITINTINRNSAYNNFSESTVSYKYSGNIGYYSNGLLSDYLGNKPASNNFIPKNYYCKNNITTGYMISGENNLIYPNPVNHRLEMSRIDISENGFLRGLLPGLMYLNNNPNFINNSIVKLNNGGYKYFFNISYVANPGNSTSTAQFTYLISLNYEDWDNYYIPGGSNNV